jgi:hypothetical protein
MEMPKPTEEHTRLISALAGHWTGTETMHPSQWDPQGGTATATIDARAACDGFCVITDYVQKRGGKVSYVGHGVTGYDAQHRRYLQHWSDSVGGMPPEAKPGVWEGDTLTFHGAGPSGRTRYVYRFVSPGVHEYKIEVSPDGSSWHAFMEGRYVRGKAKPKETRRRKPARKPKGKPKGKPKAKKGKKKRK